MQKRDSNKSKFLRNKNCEKIINKLKNMEMNKMNIINCIESENKLEAEVQSTESIHCETNN